MYVMRSTTLLHLRTGFTVLLLTITLALVGQPGASLAQSQVLADPAYDLSENQVVTNADVTSGAMAWTSLQQQGSCISDVLQSRDVNADGCVDVVDVQLIAAHIGQGTVPGGASILAAPAGPEVNFVVNAAEVSRTSGSVVNTLDDINPGDGICLDENGKCNLRAALREANARPG